MAATTKPKAIGYIRTAYDDGSDARVLRQIAVIENFCLREGIELVTTWRDMCVSGMVPFKERKGGRLVLNTLGTGLYVVVADLTRLGRSLEIIEWARIEIMHVGGDVIIAGD